MLAHALYTLTAAAVVIAGGTEGLPPVAVPAGRPNFNADRPSPRANEDPTDTLNPRLIGKRFTWPNLPYKFDTGDGPRGIQIGFNLCNSTTLEQDSMCQNIVVNTIDDFCIFIPPDVRAIGEIEAGMVAACTKPTWGTRLIPEGALTGVQFYKTPGYIAIAAKINQELLNLPAGDFGGEVDSGGQDGRGNPLGGSCYSNNLPGHEGRMTQGIVWNQFIGSNTICMKVCSPDNPDAANDCEHVYDTIGCTQNMPAQYKDNVFESCDMDKQIPVGYLVAAARSDIPSSSNCVATQSAQAYSGLPKPGNGVGPSTTSTPTPTGSTSGSGSVTRPGGSSSPRPSGTTSGSNPSDTSGPGDAATARVSLVGVAAFIPVVAGLIGAFLA